MKRLNYWVMECEQLASVGSTAVKKTVQIQCGGLSARTTDEIQCGGFQLNSRIETAQRMDGIRKDNVVFRWKLCLFLFCFFEFLL